MKKNHFNTLGLMEFFDISPKEIETKYTLTLARNHPDNFTTEAQKLEATLLCNEINEAYKVIKNKISRGKHILEINGIDIETYKPNQEFLISVLELSEEYSDNKDLRAQIDQMIVDNFYIFSQHINNCAFDEAAKILLQIIYLNGILIHDHK